MNIGSYSFAEFKALAENFHGYAAPGLLIGAYMVEYGKRRLPEGTLFEAIVETGKCLPDAVQLLTLCSTGNRRIKVINLGRYALALFDKYTGKGVRVHLDSQKLEQWPEIAAWFFKRKAKADQDSIRLEHEIEEAGDSICAYDDIVVDPSHIGHNHMASIASCPLCGEAYPAEDGPICRGCQGEAPYLSLNKAKAKDTAHDTKKAVTILPVEEAVGKQCAHDMTKIVPGQFKGPEFKEGQRITVGDICRLQQMGRFRVAVKNEETSSKDDAPLHENDVAVAFAKRMAGQGVRYKLPPNEGKIDFIAEYDGLLSVDVERLYRFNLVPEVMCASRQDGLLISRDSRFAGTRAIPLYLERSYFTKALEILGQEPLFSVLPLRKAKVGILVTGTEVFQGLIEDKFIPIITAKVTNLHCTVVAQTIVPDEKEALHNALRAMKDAGCDLIITTGGLSVDPDDVTRQALIESGLTDIVHGIPLLPGTMSVTGQIHENGHSIQVLGVPACALYFKTTAFDILLPRLLAGRRITRAEVARMGEGGYCMGCQNCTWPKCWFAK